MIMHSIKDLSNKSVVNFLKKNLKEINDPKIIKNYHPDYSGIPGNLFYILNEGRYKNGNFYILEEDNKFLGCSGWNPYVYRNQKIVLGLSRCYISKIHRNKWLIAKYFLPKTFEETINYKKIWITFNEYNKSFYRGIGLNAQGKKTCLGEAWPEIYKKFVPIGIKTIYFTKQYVIEYKK